MGNEFVLPIVVSLSTRQDDLGTAAREYLAARAASASAVAAVNRAADREDAAKAALLAAVKRDGKWA